jgi:glycosyltransferase involved in cell wall biosynthesis
VGSSRFSVAMATYNGSRYLAEQLDSLARQTQLPHELVVCDDASTDSTVRLLQEFAARDLFHVRIVRNATNRGSPSAFERAISLCAGDWIALCDQDDRWHADKLATIDRWASSCPRAGAFYSDADAIDEKGTPLGYTLWQSLGLNQAEFSRYPARVMLSKWVIFGAALVFRAEHRRLTLPFPDASMHSHRPLTGHDSWISVAIACVADVVPIPQRLSDYRVHQTQQVGIRDPRVISAKPSPSDGLRARARSRVIGNLPELETLVERLDREAGRCGDLNSSGRDVKDWLRHYRTRVNLPRQRRHRLMPIAREAASGHYASYSSGVRSIVKDLVVRT